MMLCSHMYFLISDRRLQRQNEDKLNKLEAMLARKETELKERELHLDNTIKVHQQR